MSEQPSSTEKVVQASKSASAGVLETSAGASTQTDFSSYFTRQKWNDCKAQWKLQCSYLKDIDVTASKAITKFKEDNIITLGDLRVRSVLMAVSAAFMYKAVSFRTVGLIGKTRNMAVSFAFMGYLFAPQLFNPFINKDRLAII